MTTPSVPPEVQRLTLHEVSVKARARSLHVPSVILVRTMASISIGGVSQKSLVNHCLDGFWSHVVWVGVINRASPKASGDLEFLALVPAVDVLVCLEMGSSCIHMITMGLSSDESLDYPIKGGQINLLWGGCLDLGISSLRSIGGGMYRDGGSGGSGGDDLGRSPDDGSKGDGTCGGDECAGRAMLLTRRSPAEGGNSEIGGDGDGLVMARSLSTSALVEGIWSLRSDGNPCPNSNVSGGLVSRPELSAPLVLLVLIILILTISKQRQTKRIASSSSPSSPPSIGYSEITGGYVLYEIGSRLPSSFGGTGPGLSVDPSGLISPIIGTPKALPGQSRCKGSVG
ncbi:hypothetical protein Tco_0988769 [Tanacetum coccineum]|uniref:Uncharacterized protein n=1 Tax=Tanacetum coccineum TaxID=301880 RepID=A0ABQ5ESS0_9ASTR